VRAILRRRELDRTSRSTTTRVFGSLRIDLTMHTVEIDGKPVHLTPSEFRLLALLAATPGRVRTRREIMQHLWQSSYVGDERACDVHVSNLRRKIEPDPAKPSRLVTVRGVGYRLLAV
jgi:DNA-binding response OmpR family regulator